MSGRAAHTPGTGALNMSITALTTKTSAARRIVRTAAIATAAGLAVLTSGGIAAAGESVVPATAVAVSTDTPADHGWD
ncbi:hypothetical protein ACH4MA_15360 [Streptomyces roseolus]|uniref:hypothetical protein n=2 Tax=Streptomyces roseolus TaxID=67358 RepID=UPI00379672B0